MKHLLWVFLLMGCQTPPIVNRKLDDIMVQNNAMRMEIRNLQEDIQALTEQLKKKSSVKAP